MIRITVELWPFGDYRNAKSLGVMDIWNDRSGDPKTGNYKYCIWKAGTPKDVLHGRGNPKWHGEVKGFPRKRLLVWDLLFRCLRATFGERNTEWMRSNYDFSKGIRGKYVGRVRKSSPSH